MLLLTSLLALGACEAERSAEAAPSAQAQTVAAPAPAPAPAPPKFEFEAPKPWQSTLPDTPPIAPPDPARETWRALVTQHEPLQRATPHWQPLPAERAVELAMPEGSTFRCLVTPLEVTPASNDFGTELTAWVLARSLLCSSDGFASWTAHDQVVRVRPDGARDAPEAPGALLRERGTSPSVRETYVALRSEPERREATVGPPRVLAGVKVDAD